MVFSYPNDVCFECNGCSLCCGDTAKKKRGILLLEAEAQIIAAETNLSVETFACLAPDKSPYVYEMKKSQNGKCFFLKNSQCTIYPLRPLICQFYPFELKYSVEQATHVFNATKECPALGRGRLLTKKDFQRLFVLASQRLP